MEDGDKLKLFGTPDYSQCGTARCSDTWPSIFACYVSSLYKQIFGHDDPRLTVSVTEEGQFYAVDVQIVGGDYGRSSATLKVSTANRGDDLVRAAAKGAMRVATPLIAAAYEIRHEEAHCTGSSCKYDVALEILSRLIVKPPKADDKWALLARAHIHLRLDQASHAIQDIQNATQLDSQLSDSFIYWVLP